MTDQATVMVPERRTTESLKAHFDESDIIRLEATRHLSKTERQIAYCCWENPEARGGGIFAVAEHIAEHLKGLGDVLLLSPLHTNLKTAPAPSALEPIETAAPVRTTFEGRNVEIKLYRHRDRERVRNPWVLMSATGFFEADGGEGRTSPYVYSSPCGGWNDPLLRDALFACAAAPNVLAGMNKKQNVIFHGQDWEWGALALTVNQALLKGTLESAVVVMTLHNLFDRYLPAEALRAISDRTEDEYWPPID